MEKMSVNDVVISGMSGRFPMSGNIEEFSKNLYEGKDLITEDDSRWPKDYYNINNRMGKLEHFENFDAKFFGLNEMMNIENHPQSNIILETTYEAIIDAGINPQSLRGTRSGVYIGLSNYDRVDGFPEELQSDCDTQKQQLLYQWLGNTKSLFAQRISFVFDFKGPSLVVDTQCSSSLTALYLAVNDIKQGYIDYAIVGGTHMTFEPFFFRMTQEVGICSPRGVSAVLDRSADGFVKSESIACVLLQRKSTAKRVYASIKSVRTNSDGSKNSGMFSPSSQAQENLMIMSYQDSDIDPSKLTYIEAHMTGTQVGDPKEMRAIYNAYVDRIKRTKLLPLGLLKSNMGHSEAASGISSLIKVLIVFENECIPKNINLENIREDCAQFCPPLFPNTDNLLYNPGLAAINNFGIGGMNANVLIEPNYRLTNENNLNIVEDIPRIVNICGRTDEAVEHIFNFIEKNPRKISRDFLALLAETMKPTQHFNSAGFPYRGSILIKKFIDENNDIKYEYKKQSSVLNLKNKPEVWFLFPGLGGEWPAMAKALMPIEIFREKVEECHQIMTEFGIDLKYLLLSEDKDTISTMTYKFCSKTAIEIALYEVLRTLNIIPNGIIGHSFGEVACAYADGCLTTREAMVVTYFRGVVTESNVDIPEGLMAVVGLSWEEAKCFCTEGVHIVCNNSNDTVVFSGVILKMRELISQLEMKGIYVRTLESNGIPYHCEYLNSSSIRMRAILKQYLTNPKLRSNKWVSTSVLQTNSDINLKYASAEYFAFNLINPVYFHNLFKCLPPNCIVIEISPHPLFKRIVESTIESSTYISFMKKDSNNSNLDTFMFSLAKIYGLGLNPMIEKLYPHVDWPVSRGTQSIGSLFKWDHNVGYKVQRFPRRFCRNTASDMNYSIIYTEKEQKFYFDHKINGKIIFPAIGYLMLAWRRLASCIGKNWNQIPVIFKDIQFKNPVFLSDVNINILTVKYIENSGICLIVESYHYIKCNQSNQGQFFILENDTICCVGTIELNTDRTLLAQHLIRATKSEMMNPEFTLDRDDIYKELKIMGYEYGTEFRRLSKIRTNDFKHIYGTNEWNGNFVTFMDALLQSIAFTDPSRKLMVPVMIRSIRIDPEVFFDSVEKFSLSSQNTKVIRNDEFFKNYRAHIPFHHNSRTCLFVTHGIEVEKSMIHPIHRQQVTDDLVLDSYEFIANEEIDAIDKRNKSAIEDYNKVCGDMVDFIQMLDEKFYYEIIADESFEKYRNLNDENHIMFRLLDDIGYHCIEYQKKNKTLLKPQIYQEYIFDIQEKGNYNLSEDLSNDFSINERMMRSIVDIVSENLEQNVEKKVFFINFMYNPIHKYLSEFALIPIKIKYDFLVKSNVGLNEKLLPDAIVWDMNENLVLHPSHLIVLRDTEELWRLDTELFLQEIYDAIFDKGFLLSVFKYKFTSPEIRLKSLNRNNALTTTDLGERIIRFIDIASNLGFHLICRKLDSISTMAILFRKNIGNVIKPENDQIIQINCHYEKWFESLKQKLNVSMQLNCNKNIWLIANGSSINGILGLINCLRLEPGGIALRCVFDYDNSLGSSFDTESKLFIDILRKDLVINVIKNRSLGTYRHLNLSKDYDKTSSNQFFLNLGQTRDIFSLQWFDYKTSTPIEEVYDLNNRLIKTIPVNIYTAGITFYDIMMKNGRIPASSYSMLTDCPIGKEFVGRRIDTGDRVMGFATSRGFATSINARINHISLIPEHWSMNEAITVLSTYSTVWYGLIVRAMLKRGESILIHSGAGGVGQSAIYVCKYFDCDIFVTVGREEKKLYLSEKFNIPSNRIFSSRDVEFKTKILEITNGKGVDLVLNSLTGEKWDASFMCLANGGRFIELGKFDLVQNKKLGMIDFLRDISFIGVNIDLSLEQRLDFAQNFFEWMHKNCKNGCVEPLKPIQLFDANEVEQAFRYMTTGRHMGKVAIKIRDEEIDRNKLKTVKDMIVSTKIYFNPNKVYIITGGLGGFGLELVHWMFFLGAKKFVLTSRSGMKTDYQKYVINRLKAFGLQFMCYETQISVSTSNCLTVEGTQELLNESQLLGSIGGVFHSALELNDSMLENITLQKFCSSIDTKYRIFSNLDQMTQNLGYDLDYFVVFSSLSSGFGNSGQSNYAYGNSMCERICEMRRNHGLHGLAIQYGPIDDVGVYANEEQTLHLSSLKKQRISSCCEVLDKLLAIEQPIVTSFVRASSTDHSVKSGGSKTFVSNLWQALNIDPVNIPDNLTLDEIGMESMLTIEIRKFLKKELNEHYIDLKFINIKTLRDFDSGKKEPLINHHRQLREAISQVDNFKFKISTDKYTRLNRITKKKIIYFMPPLTENWPHLETLAQKINRPVIVLNWTRDMINIRTMKEFEDYFLNLLDQLSPNDKYDIVIYFDSAFIWSRLLMENRAEKILLIDISCDSIISNDQLEDNNILKFVLDQYFSRIPELHKMKIMRKFEREPVMKQKIKYIISEIKELSVRPLNQKDMEEFFDLMIRRSRLFWSSLLNTERCLASPKLFMENVSKHSSGKLVFIKPFQFRECDDKDVILTQATKMYSLNEMEECRNNTIILEVVDSREDTKLDDIIMFHTMQNNRV